MKGGKGGEGRKRSTQRVSKKSAQEGSAKKGAAKKDWGAIPRDDDESTPKRQPDKERT